VLKFVLNRYIACPKLVYESNMMKSIYVLAYN